MAFQLDMLDSIEPFGLDKERKESLYTDALGDLTRMHYDNCPSYQRILDVLGHDPDSRLLSHQMPMLPVRLFKEYDLMSVERDQIVKTMTSSGTTGQAVSKIYLDRENTKNQTRILTKIINSLIGTKRLPMIILDTNMLKKDRAMFSARGAGIVGLSIFGRDPVYALNEDMDLDYELLEDYLANHAGERILLFGFTFIIWQHVVEAMKEKNLHLNIEDGVMIHMGGWKKLKDRAVDAPSFNKAVGGVLGNIRVYNYYGMIEQLGSVFLECEYGHMHASVYSEIFIRRYEDFSPAGNGEKGIVEVISLLPTSYPGHILLTEDVGELLGEDDCPCGRLGKYFKIHGRIPGAEIRGCSDTYERR